MHIKTSNEVLRDPEFRRAILTHGGSASDPKESDGPRSAAKIGMDFMAKGDTALNAVVTAVRFLEADPRFNAGLGSQIRIDNKTMQLDASCMTSKGDFGSVGAVEGIQNPIDIAKGVLLHSSHILMWSPLQVLRGLYHKRE